MIRVQTETLRGAYGRYEEVNVSACSRTGLVSVSKSVTGAKVGFTSCIQSPLTEVLNGIKERKVYRKLWAGQRQEEARKEGKEREREN